jgi:hypothetical protein
MEKRQRYFDIAGELNCDYLIIWDTDDYIHPEYNDFEYFNKQLENALKHPEDRIYYMWAWIPDEMLWPKQHNEIKSNIWRQYTRIHKNPGNQRYAQTHWTFANKGTTDNQINLWKWSHDNTEENPYLIPTTNTIDGIRIATDRTLRTTEDLEFGSGWTFQEIHWEGFTYELVPALKARGLNCIGMDLPMEKLYFQYRGKAPNGEDVGQVVLLNDDGTETVTKQFFNVNMQQYYK